MLYSYCSYIVHHTECINQLNSIVMYYQIHNKKKYHNNIGLDDWPVGCSFNGFSVMKLTAMIMTSASFFNEDLCVEPACSDKMLSFLRATSLECVCVCVCVDVLMDQISRRGNSNL